MEFDHSESTLRITSPPEVKSVPTRCSYCGELLAIKEWKADDKKTMISHGVCEESLRKMGFTRPKGDE